MWPMESNVWSLVNVADVCHFTKHVAFSDTDRRSWMVVFIPWDPLLFFSHPLQLMSNRIRWGGSKTIKLLCWDNTIALQFKATMISSYFNSNTAFNWCYIMLLFSSSDIKYWPQRILVSISLTSVPLDSISGWLYLSGIQIQFKC